MWNNLNDLVLLPPQQIGKYPGHFKEMLAAAQQKLNNHLCFLTKCHIVFGLASDRIVKIQLINKLMSFRSSSTPAAVIGNGLVRMPILQKSTHLPDLIGLDSFAFFLKSTIWHSDTIKSYDMAWAWRIWILQNLTSELACNQWYLWNGSRNGYKRWNKIYCTKI